VAARLMGEPMAKRKPSTKRKPAQAAEPEAATRPTPPTVGKHFRLDQAGELKDPHERAHYLRIAKVHKQRRERHEWVDDGRTPWPELPPIPAEVKDAALCAAREQKEYLSFKLHHKPIKARHKELFFARYDRDWEAFGNAFLKFNGAVVELREYIGTFRGSVPAFTNYLLVVDEVWRVASDTLTHWHEPEVTDSVESGATVFSTSGEYFAYLHDSKGWGWAKIRDHWQGLSDEERKAICPDDWELLETDQQKKDKPSKTHLAENVRGRARQWLKKKLTASGNAKK
jgi:hypothetical protein